MADWDNYYSKHCTRFYGWLPASKSFKLSKGDAKLKYLTLCDTQAIDIFMLEMEGILERDENKTLTGVTICEMDQSKIAEIFQNVNPPLREAIVKGKIQHLLLFKDTEELRSLDPDSDIRNINKRRLVNMRRDALRLQKGFPFDIINFDPCDSILNPDKDMFQVLDKIFELQGDKDEFLIFSTTPLSLNSSINKIFSENFKQNIEEYEEINDISQVTFGTTDFNDIEDPNKRAAIGFGKALIAQLSIKHGFISNQLGIYIYKSSNETVMLSSVTILSKTTAESLDINLWYPNEIVKIIKEMPIVFESSEIDEEVKDHLLKIIENRDQIQKQFMV